MEHDCKWKSTNSADATDNAEMRNIRFVVLYVHYIC
jgi:hypothetical protein